ncbi:MAG: transcription termination/antitermination factor NusG [Clostridia bacterium]|nr:transcription termination/antitermination factor NusG [Clostridia bacterium]
MAEYMDGARWYVAHTYSGYENKVKTNLEKIVENRRLQDKIFDIQIPVMTEMVQEGDTTKEVEAKVFPSYVLVKMIMTDETWHVVRNITGVTGFVGPGSRPVPLTDDEVAAIGVEKPAVTVLSFEVGDSVKIIAGALNGFIGRVEEISDDKKKVKVMASMFGRETPVELETSSVERISN